MKPGGSGPGTVRRGGSGERRSNPGVPVARCSRVNTGTASIGRPMSGPSVIPADRIAPDPARRSRARRIAVDGPAPIRRTCGASPREALGLIVQDQGAEPEDGDLGMAGRLRGGYRDGRTVEPDAPAAERPVPAADPRGLEVARAASEPDRPCGSRTPAGCGPCGPAGP